MHSGVAGAGGIVPCSGGCRTSGETGAHLGPGVADSGTGPNWTRRSRHGNAIYHVTCLPWSHHAKKRVVSGRSKVKFQEAPVMCYVVCVVHIVMCSGVMTTRIIVDVYSHVC